MNLSVTNAKMSAEETQVNLEQRLKEAVLTRQSTEVSCFVCVVEGSQQRAPRTSVS